MTIYIASNDNAEGLDWYSLPAALLLPGEPARVIAVAFSIDHPEGWLRAVNDRHRHRVELQKLRRTLRRNGWSGRRLKVS